MKTLASIHSSIKLDICYRRVIFQNGKLACSIPVVAIFHKKNGMMESVEVGVRNGKIGGRCEMLNDVFFKFFFCSILL